MEIIRPGRRDEAFAEMFEPQADDPFSTPPDFQADRLKGEDRFSGLQFKGPQKKAYGGSLETVIVLFMLIGLGVFLVAYFFSDEGAGVLLRRLH